MKIIIIAIITLAYIFAFRACSLAKKADAQAEQDARKEGAND